MQTNLSIVGCRPKPVVQMSYRERLLLAEAVLDLDPSFDGLALRPPSAAQDCQ